MALYGHFWTSRQRQVTHALKACAWFFFFFSCLIYNSQVSRIRELTAEVLSNQKYHGKTHEVNTTTPDLFPY